MNTETQVLQALARGYCTAENKGKELDNDLINAMAREVIKVFSPSSDCKNVKENRLLCYYMKSCEFKTITGRCSIEFRANNHCPFIFPENSGGAGMKRKAFINLSNLAKLSLDLAERVKDKLQSVMLSDHPVAVMKDEKGKEEQREYPPLFRELLAQFNNNFENYKKRRR